MNSTKLKLGLALIAIGVLFNGQSFADDEPCPVGIHPKSPAAPGSDPVASLDAEFGVGAAAVTRCVEERKRVKVVYQINKECKDSKCSAGYALGNIKNAIIDYEDTAGIKRGDYELVAIVHSGGTPLVINGTKPERDGKAAITNDFKDAMVDLIAQGVKVYYCQNTARKKGVLLGDLIPGVEFVTAGVTAIADFQLNGYAYVQP